MDHCCALIMTSCKEIDFGMRRNDPKPIVLPLETVHSGSFIQIPHTNGLILASRQNEILMGME